MTTTAWVEEYVEVAGAKVHLLSGGTGRPVLTLHSAEGNMGRIPFLERMSKGARVYAPTHPGFGLSERPDWLETVGDLARFYLWMLQELGLEKVSLIGHSLGGWVAAEMAVMCPHVMERLVLVDAAGIRPRDGEIADIFLLGEEETTRMSFYDRDQVPGYAELFERELSSEERELRLRSREMTTRLCWKPYMYDRSLVWLLPRVRVPTLVVWGREDRIIPLDSGRQYHEAIPGSRFEVIEGCGHLPHVEKPEEFARLVLEHLEQGL